ncbi:nitroreductase family deazaflavin-dependent oxidoreductase [Mycobacterium sp. CVI_P3]|uniref:Nitroreductase family deazaflavin-dependent oxidoreductase n=1 Tax=Mycobacterium pinniadriaticum TaxID=2994102 RepID=A0ABT3SDA9_9MYCO|nr:nitroreductase family deazaflavin-dependent oxidoreductase [Mycobacterium pinniadriaticum]MCX2930453.1 nitroreductase family deazaflavin-dependent oxidoreductase [Mycobacterium pinniadriaticum]MCX2936877.1 nitroreductase family deazaflavin-dependent oxidoreductase [Mycobacterium pinniadriaticum]
MPAPRWVAKFNKAALNKVTRFVAPWAPGWAVVIHRGRKSGRVFRTPLWAFRRGDGYVIALTYGPSTDWVRNVIAAGGCQIQSRGRHYELVNPQVYRDDSAEDMPAFIRFMLTRVIKAPEFLRLDIASAAA